MAATLFRGFRHFGRLVQIKPCTNNVTSKTSIRSLVYIRGITSIDKSSVLHARGQDDSYHKRNVHVGGHAYAIKASELSKDNAIVKDSVGCPICSRNIIFSYKDVLFLSQFLSPEGNLLNRRQTGVCKKQQLKLENAIKLSRRLGLLPKCGPIKDDQQAIDKKASTG
ncbi:uncharacterized protein LOC5508019 isoform X1 [Nematostella vectensis]|uniref:uncharacterized protein LOC5508019 isoform X1 n=1 Tax=Nematostella vectensis TaxID=45351 RepID=UPI00138FFADD|nr:uncharacterized protein LOC5508019 isoform X1 [Nematostella vectensis]